MRGFLICAVLLLAAAAWAGEIAPLALQDDHFAPCDAAVAARCAQLPAATAPLSSLPAPAAPVGLASAVPNMLAQVVDMRRELQDDLGVIDTAQLFLDRYSNNAHAPDIARRLAEAYVHLGRYAEAAAVGKEWGITVDGLPLNKKTGGARPATPLTLVPSADTTPVDHDVPAIALAIHYYFTFQQRYPENDLADDALYWAATAYAKLGLVDQAEEILEKSLALYPNGDMHTYTKRLYEQLTTRFGSPEPVF